VFVSGWRRALLGVAVTAPASGCFGASRYLCTSSGSVETPNGAESDRAAEDAFAGGSYDAPVPANDGELTGSDDPSVASRTAISFRGEPRDSTATWATATERGSVPAVPERTDLTPGRATVHA